MPWTESPNGLANPKCRGLNPNAVARAPKCPRMGPEWPKTQFWQNAVENPNAVAWKVENRQ